MLFFLCMDYVGGVNMLLRTANNYLLLLYLELGQIELRGGSKH